ncbi:MAG TPA: SDR family oxidoreductase [Kofleriaceae bacterium]|nr:SDR family oxidoreductase [Kofleriaceae bacterium]
MSEPSGARNMVTRFAGQTALVTGASRGLGRAIAQQLAGEGARVYAGFVRREDAAAETARGAPPGDGSITPLGFDVTDAGACEAAVARIVGSAGRLDLVVHAAGLVRDSLFALSSPEDWDEPLRVNLGGALRVARATVRAMLAGGGAIVFIGSVAGLRASPGQAGYAASKGGIAALTTTLAAELAPRGIRVNAVVPGLIAAGMAARLDRRIVDKQLARVPLGRLGQASEVAACALFLASPAASYVIGQSLVVDGGLSL